MSSIEPGSFVIIRYKADVGKYAQIRADDQKDNIFSKTDNHWAYWKSVYPTTINPYSVENIATTDNLWKYEVEKHSMYQWAIFLPDILVPVRQQADFFEFLGKKENKSFELGHLDSSTPTVFNTVFALPMKDLVNYTEQRSPDSIHTTIKVKSKSISVPTAVAGNGLGATASCFLTKPPDTTYFGLLSESCKPDELQEKIEDDCTAPKCTIAS